MEVDDSSSLCLACVDTIVIDNQDAAPLYKNVGHPWAEHEGVLLLSRA